MSLNTPVKRLYEKIFAEKISENVRLFLKDLRYAVLGFGLARFLTAIFNIISGRLLGPAEYGKFSLLLSIAMFLAIPAIFSLNFGMIKYCAEKEDRAEQQKIIMTSLILMSLLLIVCSMIYFLLAESLARLFGVSLFIFRLALIFAVVYALNLMITSILQGLHLIKERSFWELLCALVLIIIFVLLVFFRQERSFMAMFYPTTIAYTLVSVIVLWRERRYLGLACNRKWAGKLLVYGFYGMIGSLALTFLNNIDKILINKFLQPQDLGIYKAYYTASIGLAGSLVVLFVTAFFPPASRSKAKGKIFAKITKFIPYLFAIGFPAALAFEFLILKLYGNKYPLDFTNLLLFSLATVLTLLYSSYDWLMAAVGRRGIRVSMWGVVIAGVANFILNLYLIPAYHIRGAIIALILSYLLALGFIVSKKKVLLLPEE